MLEIAALLVLVVDLGLLRKAALSVRLAVAAALGVAGCATALIAVEFQGVSWLTFGKSGDFTLLGTGGFIAVAQIGILVLTALTLLLLFDSVFTRHIGEFVAVVLMAAAGGMLVAAAQDLLVIFVGLELLSLGLYILTAFAKSSAKSAEAAMKYYLFGGMSAAFLLFGFSYLYGLTGTTNLALIQYRITMAGPSPLFFVAWILVVAGLARSLRSRFIFGRRTPMKARPLRRRRLSLLSPRWRGLPSHYPGHELVAAAKRQSGHGWPLPRADSARLLPHLAATRHHVDRLGTVFPRAIGARIGARFHIDASQSSVDGRYERPGRRLWCSQTSVAAATPTP